ncbi:MAG: DUF1269 domain-containing protein [Chloroflexota bacterium]|nr:DUF1269 domain-containing protein [Chloroflexota bacterium]
MNTLTVFKFSTPEGAQEMLNVVYNMQNQELITIVDAAIVSWPEGRKTPKTKQAVNLTGAGAMDGAFWGMLFGLLFFIPGFGLAVGAAMGALSGHFADYGIDDNFIKRVRSEVDQGTSALFLMTTNAVVDRVVEELKDMDFELVSINLSIEQEEELRNAFGT